jgi:hypothetical protein
MKQLIWDFHGDEAKRMKFFTGINDVYVGAYEPQCDLLVMPDVPQLHQIQDRDKVIVYPCVADLTTFKQLGYKHYFAKDKAQAAQVEGAVILPPVVEYIDYKKQPTTTMVSLVHHYYHRDPKNYQRTLAAGCKVYGYPDNPIQDIPTIQDAKFVLHLKEIGYLCNVCIKAMSLTTPVIFSPESYKYGYQDYFKDGYNCIVTDDIDKAIAMPDAEYNKLRANLYKTIEELVATYPRVQLEAAKYIERIIETRHAFNPS